MANKRVQLPMAQLVPLIQTAIRQGGTALLTVTGCSMLPLLKDRVSMVKLAAPQGLKKGDIVLFRRRGGSYVLHRIVRVQGDYYDIAGDNQPTAERHIPQTAVIAKVCAYSRTGKIWRTSDKLYRLCLPAIRVGRRCGYFVKASIKKMLFYIG